MAEMINPATDNKGSGICGLVAALPGDNGLAFKDFATGAELVYNSKKNRSASLIKIYIMAEAFRQREAGLADFGELLELKTEYRVGGAGKLSERPSGTMFRLDDLLKKMIVDSDNAATNMIIDRLDMKNINDFIVACGAKNTILQRKMMDFDAVRRGCQNYTSAGDVADVLAQIYSGKLVNRVSSLEMFDILAGQNDRDGIAAVLPQGASFAGKSGELDNFNADAGIITVNGRTCILAVLCDNVIDNIQGMNNLRLISRIVLKGFGIRGVRE